MGSWCPKLSNYIGGWCQKKLNSMGGWVKKRCRLPPPGVFFWNSPYKNLLCVRKDSTLFDPNNGRKNDPPPPPDAEFNPFLALGDNCCLLYPLLMYFCVLYFEESGPRSDCSLRCSLIQVHSVSVLIQLVTTHKCI